MKSVKKWLVTSLLSVLMLALCLNMSSCGLTVLGLGSYLLDEVGIVNWSEIFGGNDTPEDPYDPNGPGGWLGNNPDEIPNDKPGDWGENTTDPNYDDPYYPEDPGEDPEDPFAGMDSVSYSVIVIAPRAVLYEERSTSSAEAGNVSEQTVLYVGYEDEEWCWVRDDWGMEGFVSKSQVADVTVMDQFTGDYVYLPYSVQVSATDLYSYPSEDQEDAQRHRLVHNDRVELLLTVGEWSLVNYTWVDENGSESSAEYFVRTDAIALAVTEGLVYEVQDDGTYWVMGAGTASNDTLIHIPATYEDVAVTGIGDGAFYGCVGVRTVVLPESIRSIGKNAFRDCNSLESINLPNDLTEISEGLFYGCNYLSDVSIPASVTCIGNGAFYNCNNIGELTFPQGLTEIGDEAFKYCNSLTEVTLPEGLTHVGREAFYDCSSLTSLSLPNSLAYVGTYAFYECDVLQYFVISGEKYLGNSDNPYLVLCGVAGQPSEFSFREGTRIIADNVFDNSDSLVSVEIPEGVVQIGAGAFNGCDVLTTVTMGNSVKYIDSEAFNSCTELESIRLSDGLISIGEHAFCECDGMTELDIPEGVTTIGKGAFEDCDALTEVEIPESLTEIGSYAFAYCEGLERVTVREGVEKIGEYAFSYNYALTHLVIPASVTEIASHAFFNCTSLVDVYYTGTEEQWAAIEMGDDLFYNAPNVIFESVIDK